MNKTLQALLVLCCTFSNTEASLNVESKEYDMSEFIQQGSNTWKTPSFSKFSPELGTLQKVIVRIQNVTVTEQRIIDIDDSLGAYQWNNYPVTLNANCLFPLSSDLEPTIDIIENIEITGNNDDGENEYNGGPDEYSFVVQHHYSDATIESESTDILSSVVERNYWSPTAP